MPYTMPLLNQRPFVQICRCDRWYDEEEGVSWIQVRLRCFHFEKMLPEVQDAIRKMERERGWL